MGAPIRVAIVDAVSGALAFANVLRQARVLVAAGILVGTGLGFHITIQ